MKSHRRFATMLLLAFSISGLAQHKQDALATIFDEASVAKEQFGADAPWYLRNIPFLEIDDADIQRVYYYRWKLYHAHMREIGEQGTTETEFLTDVPWARHPYTDLNDSSSFHILEGRWMRDSSHVQSLVDHLYAGGGNDRHFSESLAAATYAWTQVTGDPAPAIRHLDAMEHVYNLWDDHFDATRGLYWIEPLLDATEYTISSIDASGAGFTETPSKQDFQNGFRGGDAFRPSINAYQFANAKAIASLARISGADRVATDFEGRAEALRSATLQQLWNPTLNHFTDIYQRSTPTVKVGEFIRGRELVGFVPWMFDLPPQTAPVSLEYATAWKHALSHDELAGPFGLRTTEPSYPRYMHQYRYDQETGKPECQWNGPSWPFQTSQTLTGMANLLHGYPQQVVTNADYLHLLLQYTRQHFTADGTLDLQEEYNPDTGIPIVGLSRSHHYNHSTYIDLILSGLLGIQPRSDDMLQIAPLLPSRSSSERPIRFFALQHLQYHGHDLTVLYDETGQRYGKGSGLSVFEGTQRLAGPTSEHQLTVKLQHVIAKQTSEKLVDVAVNAWAHAPSQFEPALPIASASPSNDDAHLYEAIDGRTWFFPEIPNGWSPTVVPDGREHQAFEYTIDLRHSVSVQTADLYFFSDEKTFFAPKAYRLQAFSNKNWIDVPGQHRSSTHPIANGENHIDFPDTSAQKFRVLLSPPQSGRVRLVEFKLMAKRSVASCVARAIKVTPGGQQCS